MYERYHEAVDYLQRRLWHELPIMPVERALQSRIRTLLAHFGDPHLAVPVIHVGGSAGKGSTATMIASILRAAGLRTGLYTSPHLQTFIERIDVNGELIAPDKFADLVLGLEPLVRKVHIDVLDGVGFGRPSLVEVAFAVGMKHFADERCDVAVIEVGLGGRTDCTNVFDDPIPLVTVLTNVEMEHVERLGPTIADIAGEKSAIIKGGVVITGAQRQEALDVIERQCSQTGAKLWRLGPQIVANVVCRDKGGTTFDLRTPKTTVKRVRMPVTGEHQVGNAALAIAAVFSSQTGIRDDDVRRGMDALRINARMEIVETAPRVILDGAHNPAEAKATARAVQEHWLSPAQPGAAVSRVHLVCGILADKAQRAMVREFASIAGTVVVTQPPLSERAGSPEGMLSGFRGRLGEEAVTYEASPERALDLALARASAEDIVLVTGSMFLAGGLRERWVPEARILERRSAALR
jgi:dihydrofolate synthase/folylpolyglutamate synthase